MSFNWNDLSNNTYSSLKNQCINLKLIGPSDKVTKASLVVKLQQFQDKNNSASSSRASSANSSRRQSRESTPTNDLHTPIRLPSMLESAKKPTPPKFNTFSPYNMASEQNTSYSLSFILIFICLLIITLLIFMALFI